MISTHTIHNLKKTSTEHAKAAHDLAVFSGRPAFAEPIFVGRPNHVDPQAFHERMNEAFQRGWLTNHGQYVREFEQRVAEIADVRNCVALCNATVGLQVALRAAGVTGEVIVPSFTFVATAHAARWLGIKPVFCDVAPGSHHIDPQQIEALITPRTTAILGVHLWGEACEVEALCRVAHRHRLKLLFDAAHAFACAHQGRMIGGFGAAEVFSFHATKFIHTFEGGAVCTNDDRMAEVLRQMISNGISLDGRAAVVGTNGKMSEAAAAMGLTNLENLSHIVGVNRRNYEAYRRELQGIAGVSLRQFDPTQRMNYQYIVLEIDQLQTKISRDAVLKILVAENVYGKPYFSPGVHRLPPYCNELSYGREFPETERLSARVLTLPTGTSVDVAKVATICRLLRVIVANGEYLASQIATP